MAEGWSLSSKRLIISITAAKHLKLSKMMPDISLWSAYTVEHSGDYIIHDKFNSITEGLVDVFLKIKMMVGWWRRFWIWIKQTYGLWLVRTRGNITESSGNLKWSLIQIRPVLLLLSGSNCHNHWEHNIPMVAALVMVWLVWVTLWVSLRSQHATFF
jgi:hypothetical protein